MLVKASAPLTTTLFVACLLLISCSSEQNAPQRNTGMKCGAGKCGANMFDGSDALQQKKANILRQMRDNDPRERCVMQAMSTAALYDCVRDPNTRRLSKQCGSALPQSAQQKCGGGKCGAGKCGG